MPHSTEPQFSPAARAVLDRVGLGFLADGGPAFIADAQNGVVWANAPWRDFEDSLAPDNSGHALPWSANDFSRPPPLMPVVREDRLLQASGAIWVKSRHWPAFDAGGEFIGWAGNIDESTLIDRQRR